jgi:hypothetical protein
MRIEKSVTSITWIPSEAISGMPKLPFEMGVAHYDDPPPDKLDDLEALRQADAFREANELRAWVEFEDGKPSLYGYSGGGHIGVTRIKLGRRELTFPAVQYPLLQAEPEVGDGWVKFKQSAGGHMGLPAPRRVSGKPFFRIKSASAWTTLGADDQRGRYRRACARGGEPVPAPLALRRRQQAGGEVGHDRLRGVVQDLARQEHAVGRGGFAGADDGSRVRPRARAFGLDHA